MQRQPARRACADGRAPAANGDAGTPSLADSLTGAHSRARRRAARR